MPVDVTRVLQKALSELQSQQARLDRQIVALHAVLGGDSTPAPAPGSALPTRKRRMSAAARRAVGARMKAYWAKRREASTTTKRTATKKPRSVAKRGQKRKT